VLGRGVVPELLFTEPDAAALATATRALIDDPAARHAQLAAFAKLRSLMEKGTPEAPLVDPAERVRSHVR